MDKVYRGEPGTREKSENHGSTRMKQTSTKLPSERQLKSTPPGTTKKRSPRQHLPETESRRLPSTADREKESPAQTYKLLGAIAVLLTASLLVFQLCAHLALTFDEGIYLYGAQRLLTGQHLYRDFFLFTGPGTLWLLAGLFKLFGPSFAAAHGLLALEIGLITSAVYAIVACRGKAFAGIGAAASFPALLLPFSQRLYVNHRWDSCCCIVLAITFLLYSPGKRVFLIVSGVLAGLAAVFTPPVLWVVLAVTVYLLAKRETRREAAWFIGAACIPLALTAIILALEGSLAPMLASFRWVGVYYWKANSVPYGFSAEAPSVAHKISPLQSLIFEIPSLLPFVGVLLLAVLRIRRIAVPYPASVLTIAGLGMVASLYPRWSTDQLLFAAPFFLALLFILASLQLRPHVMRLASIAISAVACLIVLDALTHLPPTVSVTTQLGEVACQYRAEPNVEFAASVIQPGDNLFVYPYQPIWYALTGGVNSTRFNFLQPGMMTPEDENTALRELTAHPPQWVIWHKLTPQMVLTIWPNSDRSTLQFGKIEHWIRANYNQIAPPNPRYHYAIAIFRKNGS